MLGPKATGAEEAAQREHKEDTKEGESKPCPEPIRPMALKVLSGLESYQTWSWREVNIIRNIPPLWRAISIIQIAIFIK